MAKWSTKEKTHAMKWGAARLYESDPEHFVGACGDIAGALEGFAKELGITGVKAVGGRARTTQEWQHAWITIDGKVFDPRKVIEGRKYRQHTPDKTTLAMLCDPYELEAGGWGDPEPMIEDWEAGKTIKYESPVDGTTVLVRAGKPEPNPRKLKTKLLR